MFAADLLSAAVVVPAAAVIVAVFVVLWRQHRSRREAGVALASGGALALWLIAEIALARKGSFVQAAGAAGPPGVGINLVAVLIALTVVLAVSPSLRSLLSRQSSLIRLHLWRFEGALFLILMAQGRLPALFALPAGIGDILVAATAPWVARRADTGEGKRLAIMWNILGLTDLIVAIALGVMTNPGTLHVFNTVPDSAAMAHFPTALIPTFFVPLAMTLHVISLWQLLRGSWVRERTPEAVLCGSI
jgi:hypothetical protein